MRIFLKAALLLLLFTVTSNAQLREAGEIKAAEKEIPTMEEWWRADGISNGRGISFLPNFKDGYDAVVVTTYKGMHTWFNRFPGDTENVFTWAVDAPAIYAENYKVRYGDVNGDGIRDYIAPHGFIYRGIENGQPPENTPIKQYFLGNIIGVFDFNQDGFDDVYGALGIIYGGSDLSALVRTPVPQGIFDENRTFSALYQTTQGEFRFVIQNTKAKSYDGYELYRATWEKGGTQPVFVKLDSIRQSLFATQKDFFYINGQQALYQSKKNGKPYLIVMESVDGSWTNTNVVIFDLLNDKITQYLKVFSKGSPNILNHSIDGDDFEDWYIRQSTSEVWFFSGGEKLDSIPRIKVTNFQIGSIASIRDVSGDGINDVALGYNTIGIFKGIDLRTNVVNDKPHSPAFAIGEPLPQPVKSRQPSSVLVSISQFDQYTLSLYSIEGKQVSEVFKGRLETGEHRIPLNLVLNSITSGSYILRLSNGKESVERTIIITN